MSASTVSITANPATTAARRRAVEKKTGLDLLHSVAAVSPAAAVSGGDPWIERDLGNAIRVGGGEAVVEKSRDVVRKSLTSNGAAVPRRTSKKSSTKHEKPLWLTVLSVLSKNLALLLVILSLFLIIRRLIPNNQPTGNPTISSDFEGRIVQLETSVKTTIEFMQFQVDAVHKGVDNGIGALRKELNKKIEEKSSDLSSLLTKLDAKTDNLEKLVGEFRSSDWLSKQDFDRFLDEFRKENGESGGSKTTSLDELRALAREILMKEIDKHAADGLGRVDYALASGGGMVLKHSKHYIVGKGSSSWFSIMKPNEVHKDAEKMLTPSFGEPGKCFPLKGSTGFVQIKLRTAIIPEAITLEHVSKSVAYDRSSAPKDCRVSGWLQGHVDAPDLAVNTEKMFLLTEFTYDFEKSNAQTFSVFDSAGVGSIDVIRLDFTSNHGSPSHTCIYRLRVHGYEPQSVPMLSMQS